MSFNPPIEPNSPVTALPLSSKLDFRSPLMSKNPLFTLVLASENWVFTESSDGTPLKILSFNPPSEPSIPPPTKFDFRLPILSKKLPGTISERMLLLATIVLKAVDTDLGILLIAMFWICLLTFANEGILLLATIAFKGVDIAMLLICLPKPPNDIFFLEETSVCTEAISACSLAFSVIFWDWFFRLSKLGPVFAPSVGTVPPPGISPPPPGVVVKFPVFPAPVSPKFWGGVVVGGVITWGAGVDFGKNSGAPLSGP